ncbi:MAG: hypothetical protein QOF33_4576 [Thermomicrobiales bacterium]|jgi:hypothetical protein|nr:hypothetical protein [Thermomicrobiales bacterium]
MTEISDLSPSHNEGDYWLYARSPRRPTGIDPAFVGKWMVFADEGAVDALWAVIRDAVERGELSFSAKVGTVLQRRDSQYGQHVICVYTADHRDETERRRVRESLRSLGVTWTIGYKTDQATRDGRYAGPGRGVTIERA